MTDMETAVRADDPDTARLTPEVLASVAFLGDTLAPLFLYEPNAPEASAMLEAIAALDAAEAAKEWPFVHAGEVEGDLACMASALGEGVTDGLLWDFRGLFAGPGYKKCPPWGSVYTDRECVIFGEATLALRQWMREQGISRPGDGTEPEDHIGLMLLLMSWLARNRPELLEEYLSEHLLTWAPHFLELMEETADEPFYAALARLAHASLDGMQATLALEVEVPRFYR